MEARFDKDLSSAATMASRLGKSTSFVEEQLKQKQLRPALRLDGVDYYDRTQVEILTLAVGTEGK